MTVQREERPMQAIQELVISGSADVFVKRGEPSMNVIAENPEEVITEIRGGVLTISQKPTLIVDGDGCMVIDGVRNGGIQIGNAVGNITISRGNRATQVFYGNVGTVLVGGGLVSLGKRVTVEIALPNLPAACIKGSGDLSLDGLLQDEIDLKIIGSGCISATGEVMRLKAAISGSGDVKAKELMASIAELRVSGSGDIKAKATQALVARVSGSGDIKVWGNPAQRDTRVSGSGDIKFK